MQIGSRALGPDQPPFVIAEIGINHEGDPAKARRMIDDAAAAGCECVKFQSHVIEDEYVPAAGKVIPGNAKESILEIMRRCAFDEPTERELKAYTESKGLIYLSTPFSRARACNSLPTLLISPCRSNTALSSSNRPASSLEKSRMSFSTACRLFADCCRVSA